MAPGEIYLTMPDKFGMVGILMVRHAMCLDVLPYNRAGSFDCNITVFLFVLSKVITESSANHAGI